MKKITYISVLLFVACAKGPLVQVSQSRHADSFFARMSNRVVQDSNLVLDGENFYFGTKNGTVFCVKSKNHHDLWSEKLSASIDTSILVDATKAFAGTGDGKVYAMNKATGKVLWNVQLASPPRGMMTKVGSIVIVGINDGTLVALDQENGSVLWKYHHEPYEKMKIQFFVQGSVENNRLFIGFPNGQLVALDAQTGTEVWNKFIQDSQARFYDLAAIVLVPNKGILASLVNGPTTMYSFDGLELWSVKNTSTQAAPVILNNGQVLIAAKDSLIWLDDDGHQKSELAYGRIIRPAGVSSADGLIYVSSFDGSLHVFNDKQWLWEYQMGLSLQGSPIVLKGQIWTLNRRGQLISMKRNN